MNKKQSSSEKEWWGQISVEEKQQYALHFDGLDFTVAHHANEWQVSHVRTPAKDTEKWSKSISTIKTASDIVNDTNTERFICKPGENSIEIRPVTGDRPFVIKPSQPVQILGNESAIIYVSTALWIGVAIGKNKTPLTRIAIQQPSDTWIGPDTLSGQLCYASRTAGRLDKNLLPKKPYRAFTQVKIENKADSPLKLEKFVLPSPNLSLFSDTSGMLWTETVTLERNEKKVEASVSIGKSAPTDIGPSKLVNGPIEPLKSGKFAGRISHIFG